MNHAFGVPESRIVGCRASAAASTFCEVTLLNSLRDQPDISQTYAQSVTIQLIIRVRQSPLEHPLQQIAAPCPQKSAQPPHLLGLPNSSNDSDRTTIFKVVRSLLPMDKMEHLYRE